MEPDSIPGDIGRFMREYYFPEVIGGLSSIDDNVLNDISDKVAQRIMEGKRIFAFGNGGSEAIAEGFIHTLEQRIYHCKFDAYCNPGLRRVPDAEFNLLFDRRIKTSGRSGDLAILISASGNSENILNASALCSGLGIESLLLSGNGAIAGKSDYPVVLQIHDQQILEDVILGFLYIVSDVVEQKVIGLRYDVAQIKEKYTTDFDRATKKLDYILIWNLAQDILRAYKEGLQVRIDAPDSGLLSANAGHMQHNLKWDAFQNVVPRLPNRVLSGLPTYHFSGVSNDGGEDFNYAIEIEDNCVHGDVEVVFARDLNSKSVQTLLQAAKKKGMSAHTFGQNYESSYIASNICQSVLHLTSRVINAHLLSEKTSYADFELRLRQDLALLRQKNQTQRRLEATYK